MIGKHKFVELNLKFARRVIFGFKQNNWKVIVAKYTFRFTCEIIFTWQSLFIEYWIPNDFYCSVDGWRLTGFCLNYGCENPKQIYNAQSKWNTFKWYWPLDYYWFGFHLTFFDWHLPFHLLLLAVFFCTMNVLYCVPIHSLYVLYMRIENPIFEIESMKTNSFNCKFDRKCGISIGSRMVCVFLSPFFAEK